MLGVGLASEVWRAEALGVVSQRQPEIFPDYIAGLDAHCRFSRAVAPGTVSLQTHVPAVRKIPRRPGAHQLGDRAALQTIGLIFGHLGSVATRYQPATVGLDVKVTRNNPGRFVAVQAGSEGVVRVALVLDAPQSIPHIRFYRAKGKAGLRRNELMIAAARGKIGLHTVERAVEQCPFLIQLIDHRSRQQPAA